MLVAVDTPQRPVSSAGLDGASVVVSKAARRADLAVWLRFEELTAQAAELELSPPTSDRSLTASADEETETAGSDLEVRAEEPAEVGLLEGIIGAVIGFLFG